MTERPIADTASRDLMVLVLPSQSEDVVAAERALDASGFAIPLSSRVSWARHLGTSRDRTAIARSPQGEVAMVALSITPTRALPMHHVLRVEAFGEPYANVAGRALLDAIVHFSRRQPAILRAVIELECQDDIAREQLRASLTAAGFVRVPTERISERTLVIDLRMEEEALFATFGRSTRQNVRGAAKHDLQVVALDDPACGPRMNALLSESLARTGAPAQVVDWAAVFAMTREIPHRSRVAGVFRGAGRDPESLVGYAWGLHHGERVEYHTGASARVPGVRLPILYPALWDLIAWGRRTGGTWFDLGGVTQGTLGSSDALGGISDFKRGFSKTEIEVGEEWAYVPHPWRAKLAGWTSQLARRVRQVQHERKRAAAARTDAARSPAVRPGPGGGAAEPDSGAVPGASPAGTPDAGSSS